MGREEVEAGTISVYREKSGGLVMRLKPVKLVTAGAAAERGDAQKPEALFKKVGAVGAADVPAHAPRTIQRRIFDGIHAGRFVHNHRAISGIWYRRSFQRRGAGELTRGRKASQHRGLPGADVFERLQPVFDLIGEGACVFLRDMFRDALKIPQ